MTTRNGMVDRIEQLTREVEPQVISWRRDFHRHPELSNREQRTARVVATTLQEIGADSVQCGVAHHGVVALIHGTLQAENESTPDESHKRTIALRADMDALPVTEETGLSFASENQGVMHACGHDAHTAMLLGAARVLCALRDRFAGTVKLIFQPAEEGFPPEEFGGAPMMVQQGVLTDPVPEAIFGLHVFPDARVGSIEYAFGGITASVDRFRVTISGRQTHGAMPWKGDDSIVAAAQIVTALQTIAARRIDARQAVVVSVDIIQGGENWNIAPETVYLEGTVRTHHPKVRDQVESEFRHIIESTSRAHHTSADIQYWSMVPATINDDRFGQTVLESLGPVFGEEHLHETVPAMIGEDFSYFAREIPGFFIFLGVRSPDSDPVFPLHSPRMMIDENALSLGVKAHVATALGFLSRLVD